jgi:predicted ester cyclase
MTRGNLAIVRELSKIFNDRDYEIAPKLLAPDFVDHEAAGGNPYGPEGYVQTAKWIHSVVTDARWVEEDGIATDDRVVIRLRFSGQHTGELLGISATGRTFSVTHIHVYRLVDGMIVEHWAVRDDLGMLQQLGVVPPPYA